MTLSAILESPIVPFNKAVVSVERLNSIEQVLSLPGISGVSFHCVREPATRRFVEATFDVKYAGDGMLPVFDELEEGAEILSVSLKDPSASGFGEAHDIVLDDSHFDFYLITYVMKGSIELLQEVDEPFDDNNF